VTRPFYKRISHIYAAQTTSTSLNLDPITLPSYFSHLQVKLYARRGQSGLDRRFGQTSPLHVAGSEQKGISIVVKRLRVARRAGVLLWERRELRPRCDLSQTLTTWEDRLPNNVYLVEHRVGTLRKNCRYGLLTAKGAELPLIGVLGNSDYLVAISR